MARHCFHTMMPYSNFAFFSVADLQANRRDINFEPYMFLFDIFLHFTVNVNGKNRARGKSQIEQCLQRAGVSRAAPCRRVCDSVDEVK